LEDISVEIQLQTSWGNTRGDRQETATGAVDDATEDVTETGRWAVKEEEGGGREGGE